MSLYHAWIPNKDGSQPTGTIRQIVRSDLGTDRGAIRWARRALGPSVHVEAYRDSIHFYADENGRKVIQPAWDQVKEIGNNGARD